MYLPGGPSSKWIIYQENKQQQKKEEEEAQTECTHGSTPATDYLTPAPSWCTIQQ